MYEYISAPKKNRFKPEKILYFYTGKSVTFHIHKQTNTGDCELRMQTHEAPLTLQ